jgi:hypothetical protein
LENFSERFHDAGHARADSHASQNTTPYGVLIRERTEMNNNDFNETSSLHSRLAAAPYVALVVLTVGALLFAAGTDLVDVAPAQTRTFRVSNAESTQWHDHAVQAFVAQRDATAYGRFAALADEGRAPLALVALALLSRSASAAGGERPGIQGPSRSRSVPFTRQAPEFRAQVADIDRGE